MSAWDFLVLMVVIPYLILAIILGIKYVIRNNVLDRLIDDIEYEIYKSLKNKFESEDETIIDIK